MLMFWRTFALPLIAILFVSVVIILFHGFFSNDDGKSNPKDVYQFDRYGERAGLWTWHFPNGEKGKQRVLIELVKARDMDGLVENGQVK